jgi:HEAT repeat protein
MIGTSLAKHVSIAAAIGIAAVPVSVSAQPPAAPESTSSAWWVVMAVLVFGGLTMAVWFWRKAAAVARESASSGSKNRYANYYSSTHQSYELSDAAAELERMRKTKRSEAKTPSQPKISYNATRPEPTAAEDVNRDAKAFQEKMRKLQYSQLPINSFSELRRSKLYDPLFESGDPALLNAIEQANEEYEEDETVRELAVRVLAAFKTRNSVEALSQIALYDLSSNLRARAVSILTEFDHESVFETIVLACADPTREVRAAAARGLFRLSFDRADAWKRIIETEDEFRMSHAARAATEAGIVVKTFDRLVHDDLKIAYEAFVLVSLLVRAGETREIFDAIRNHRDERVRFALLHVLRVQRDSRTLKELYELQKDSGFPTDVAERVREAILSMEEVAA